MPAGVYHVEIDEELIEAIDRTIYRRVEARLRIQTVGRTMQRRLEPADLEAVIVRDGTVGLKIADRHSGAKPNEYPTEMPGTGAHDNNSLLLVA